jgi:hypothetical protein
MSTSVGEAIRTELVADTAVTTLVGQQIYPNLAPQGTVPPYVVYTVISNVPSNTFTGAASDRLNEIRMQVDCYAKKYLDAQAIAEAVDNVISNLSRPRPLRAARKFARPLRQRGAVSPRADRFFHSALKLRRKVSTLAPKLRFISTKFSSEE